jgi:hypothetical protein
MSQVTPSHAGASVKTLGDEYRFIILCWDSVSLDSEQLTVCEKLCQMKSSDYTVIVAGLLAMHMRVGIGELRSSQKPRHHQAQRAALALTAHPVATRDRSGQSTLNMEVALANQCG